MKNKTRRYKYRGYWVKINFNYNRPKNSYQVVVWIVGHPEQKQILNEDAYSRGQGEAQAEHHIDKAIYRLSLKREQSGNRSLGNKTYIELLDMLKEINYTVKTPAKIDLRMDIYKEIINRN